MARGFTDRAEIYAFGSIEFRQPFQRAMNVDRPVIGGNAQQCYQSLRLAERIGADEMRPLGKELPRSKEFGNLAAGIGMPEDR